MSVCGDSTGGAIEEVPPKRHLKYFVEVRSSGSLSLQLLLSSAVATLHLATTRLRPVVYLGRLHACNPGSFHAQCSTVYPRNQRRNSNNM